MPDPIRRIRHTGQFPVRGVASVLVALANDFETMLANDRVLLSERVRWIKSSEANATAFYYAVVILLNQAGWTPEKLRALAADYQRVMATGKIPVRPAFTTGARKAPPLPPAEMFHVKPPSTKEVDQA